MKVYYLPFYATSFFPTYDVKVFGRHFARWMIFFQTREMIAPADTDELIKNQIEATQSALSSRQILKVPIAMSVGVCDFELMLRSGALPTCSGGFVQCSAVQVKQQMFAEIVEERLADVLVFSADDNSDRVSVIGPAWAIYLDAKLHDFAARSEKIGVRRGQSAEGDEAFL